MGAQSGQTKRMDIYLFGAGASAAEGAPGTDGFLAAAWRLLGPDFDARVQAVWRFLSDVFGVPLSGPSDFACLPAVDEVFSLVDWTLHCDQGLGSGYAPPRLYQVRRDLEYLLGMTLDTALAGRRPASLPGPHARFARAVAAAGPERFALLSLNYDTLLDEALAAAGIEPDYGFVAADLRQRGTGPLLCKLHGSLNWALCPACDRVAVVRPGAGPCARCGAESLRSLIISPTWRQGGLPTQLRQVWDLALEAIQQAERLTLVGYSLPPADVPIYQLIRRGLLTRRTNRPPAITIIDHRHAEAAAGVCHWREEQIRVRFTRLFGPGVHFDFTGFDGRYI